MVFWVFGYGSLVWNPGFDYDEKIMGHIKDYRRVFDLGKCFVFFVFYVLEFCVVLIFDNVLLLYV